MDNKIIIKILTGKFSYIAGNKRKIFTLLQIREKGKELFRISGKKSDFIVCSKIWSMIKDIFTEKTGTPGHQDLFSFKHKRYFQLYFFRPCNSDPTVKESILSLV